eukprot:gene12669-15902_t
MSESLGGNEEISDWHKQVFSLGTDELGDGQVLFEWSPKGNYLAVAGSKRKVIILDRNGRAADEIQLPQPELPLMDSRASCCTHIKWDPSGEQLAILPSGNTVVFLWSAFSPGKEPSRIDTEFKEPSRIDTEFKSQEFSVLSWSKNGAYLAVGTVKGNLLMYSSRERKRVPYVGKHTKKIVSAVWNKGNLLAMAGLDRMVTITAGDTGETTQAFQLKGDPSEICVSDCKDDGYSKKEENDLTLQSGGRTIYIMQCMAEGDKPLELAFLEQYGPIQKHMWFGDGYILVGFKFGQIVVVSSHSREIGEEVHGGKYLDSLTDMAYCPALGRIAMGGNSSIRILDASGHEYMEVKSDAIDLSPNERVDKVGWSKDGQVLTVSTTSGMLYSYLAALPSIFDVHMTKVMYLTSLLEMSIVDIHKRLAPVKIALETEPAFCGLGPTHAALGMNNQVWFYRHGRVGTGELVNKRNYMGSVEAVRLNSTHAAVQVDGRVIVHPIEIELGRQMDEFDVVLPPQGQPQHITCVAISEHFVITGSKQGILSYFLVEHITCVDIFEQFVITGSKQGILSYFLVEDCSPVNEYRHDDGGLSRIFPQPSGSRLIFQDERGNICLFNPVNDQVLVTPPIGSRVENVVWDVNDPNVFVIAEANQLSVFLYSPVSLSGAKIDLIGTQVTAASHTPVVLSAGLLGCRLTNGSLDNVTLDTHRAINTTDAMAKTNLGQLRTAWDCAVQLRNTEAWTQLAHAALEMLDLDMAIASYRMLGDPSMVLSLEGIRQYEDKNLLSAHIMVLLERDYADAQELFLRSSVPKAALEMRKDLKHWSEALKLAETLDPDGIALICKEHAASLEMTAEYNNAKSHYQQALDALMGQAEDKELELACRSGIARTTLHMGDIRQGRTMALALNSVSLLKECGSILEGLQQLTEAGEMYEKAGMYERAASIYIQTKNYAAAAPLMAKVSSSKLHLQYAKAKETEGRFSEAAVAFEAAGDMDSVVRLCLEQLNAPQRAYAIVRKTRSVEAAALLARYCLQNQDFAGAVEFLLLAGQMDQAFDIAQGHNEMDTFARIVQSSAKTADYNRIAQYYEGRGEFDKAGDMYASSEQYPRAVQLYLKVGNNATLEKAIGVVERTKSHQLE